MFLRICIKLLYTYINTGGLGGGGSKSRDLGGPYRDQYLAVKCDSSEVDQLI